MTQINNLVKEAMGYRQSRGDTLNVVNASFSSVVEEIPEIPLWKDPATISLAKEIGRNLFIAAVVFYLVFGVLRPLLKNLSTPPELPAPTAEEEHPKFVHGSHEERLVAAKELARTEPKIVAGVVKDWIGGNE